MLEKARKFPSIKKLIIARMSYCLTSKLCWLERNSNLPPKFEIDCLSTCQLDANQSTALPPNSGFALVASRHHQAHSFASWKPFQSHFATTSDLRWRPCPLCLRRRRLINGGGHGTLYARGCWLCSEFVVHNYRRIAPQGTTYRTMYFSSWKCLCFGRFDRLWSSDSETSRRLRSSLHIWHLSGDSSRRSFAPWRYFCAFRAPFPLSLSFSFFGLTGGGELMRQIKKDEHRSWKPKNNA